jgi:hypothetical protein
MWRLLVYIYSDLSWFVVYAFVSLVFNLCDIDEPFQIIGLLEIKDESWVRGSNRAVQGPQPSSQLGDF